ncbi:hypothetical protein DA803_01915 [[Mycoplasma] phocae]|uniref:Lipoprotein n=1 Tax=[Mycoplasma] phocae TaxID=142651 RepID=A0A2Z5IQ53_9BACT|nr:variable surface lipoprotein [[Mycoplasma] phocae]AXE60839.1 hypothetical protein DA803_01915 [[Mycoplasma] phocae]
MKKNKWLATLSLSVIAMPLIAAACNNVNMKKEMPQTPPTTPEAPKPTPPQNDSPQTPPTNPKSPQTPPKMNDSKPDSKDMTPNTPPPNNMDNKKEESPKMPLDPKDSKPSPMKPIVPDKDKTEADWKKFLLENVEIDYSEKPIDLSRFDSKKVTVKTPDGWVAHYDEFSINVFPSEDSKSLQISVNMTLTNEKYPNIKIMIDKKNGIPLKSEMK